MQNQVFSNLVIKIQGDDQGILVKILSRDNNFTYALSIPDWNFFEDRLTEIGLYHSQRTFELPSEFAKRETTKEFGSVLLNSLLSNPQLRKIYDQTLAGDKKLRLALDIESNELQRVPWEYLFDEKHSFFVNLDNRFSIVRLVPKILFKRQNENIADNIHVLTVTSSPQGSSTINYLREKRFLLEAQHEAMIDGRNIIVTPLELQSTYQALQNQIRRIARENPFQILHFSGHGEFDDKEGGRLLLENEANQKDWIRASSFSNLVRGLSHLRIAVINACESAIFDSGDPSRGIASSLISARIPSVIAMLTDIKDLAATNFIKGLYSALFEGAIIDESVTSGRRVIETSSIFSSYWGVPILFLSEPYDFYLYRTIVLNKKTTISILPTSLVKSNNLQSFVSKQRERILNMPIVPWIASQSPSLDFIWPKLFVDPFVKTGKHPGGSRNLSDWREKFWQFGRNTIISGPAGIGKTTSLLALFLEAISSYQTNSFDYLPLYIRAADLTEENTKNIKKLIQYFADDYGLQEISTPSRILLFIDGVDEVAPEKIIPILRLFLTGPISEQSFFLACRDTYFHDYISSDLTLSQRFFEILELSPWEPEISLNFAREYLIEAQKLYLFDTLIEACQVSEVVKLFLSRPFQLTMLLYLLTTEDRLLPAEISNIYSLYKTFYQSWIHRENARGSSWLPPSIIEKIHRSTAVELYSNKGTSLPLDFLIEVTKNKVQENIKIIQDSAVISLLEIKKSAYSQSLRIVRFVHETLGEYHVAENLLACIFKGGKDLEDALSIIYNYEVNSFVREAFEIMPPEDKTKVLKNLSNLYVDLTGYSEEQKTFVTESINSGQPSGLPRISSEGGMRNPSARKREQILYYLGRLPLLGSINVFRFAIRHEGVSVLRRIAAISGTLQGAFDIEREYVESLVLNSSEDLENRSVQLVYFGDIEGELGIFQDDGKCLWDNTKRAICDRLKRNGPREMQLRWWDLRTLYLFCESRFWKNQLSRAEIDIIKGCEVSSIYLPPEKEVEIVKEKEKILIKAINLA